MSVHLECPNHSVSKPEKSVTVACLYVYRMIETKTS